MIRELDEAARRLVEGQYLDIDFESRDVVTRGDYLEMIEGKTAALFAAAGAIGARLANAPLERIEALRNWGRHVGLAFQAVDDLLGVWGDPELTGKPARDDLRTRKMSFPVLAWLEADAGSDLAAAYRDHGAALDVEALALVARPGRRARRDAGARRRAHGGGSS